MTDEEYASKIVIRIKQILPIGLGWVHQFLVDDSTKEGGFRLEELPITGQALVERTFPDGTIIDEVELLVYDNCMGAPRLVGEFEESMAIHNVAYPVGVCTPNFRNKIEDLDFEIGCFKTLKKEREEERAARKAARKVAQ